MIVGVGVSDGVRVLVGVLVIVGVNVFVGVFVGVGVGVRVGVCVGVGVLMVALSYAPISQRAVPLPSPSFALACAR